jgi:hypothetical protein
MRFRTAAVMLLWLLASTFAAAANQNTDPVARPRRPHPNVLQAFDDLLRRLEYIKRGELPHGQKTSLFVKVAAARHQPIQLSAGFDIAVSVALKTNPGQPTIN